MDSLYNNFEAVWDNIALCEGQTFATVTGQPFAYDVQEDGLSVRRSDLLLPKEELEKLYRAGLADGGGRGKVAAYCYAVLRDNRIRV